jgi:hypothetical protein
MRDSEPYAKTVKSHLNGASGMTDFKAPGEKIDNSFDAGGAARCVTLKDGDNKYKIFFNTGTSPEDNAVLIGLGPTVSKTDDKIGLKGRGGMSEIWHYEPNAYIAVGSDSKTLNELKFACHDYANRIREVDRTGGDLTADVLKPTNKKWKLTDGGVSKTTELLLLKLCSLVENQAMKAELTSLIEHRVSGLIQVYEFEPTHPKYASFDLELAKAIPSFNLFHGEILKARNCELRFELHNMPQPKVNATAKGKGKGKGKEKSNPTTRYDCLTKETAIDLMMGSDYLTCRFEFAFFETKPVLKVTVSNNAATMTPYEFYAVGDGKTMIYRESFVEWEMADNKGFCHLDVGYLDTEKETKQKKAFGAKAEDLRGAWTFWNKRACGLPSSIKSIVRARDAGGLRIATRVEKNQFIITQVQHVCNDKSAMNDDEVPYYFREVRDLILSTVVNLIQKQKEATTLAGQVDIKQWSPKWNDDFRTAIVAATPIEGRIVPPEPKKPRKLRRLKGALPEAVEAPSTTNTDLAPARAQRQQSQQSQPIKVAEQTILGQMAGHVQAHPGQSLPSANPIPEPPPLHGFTFSKASDNTQLINILNGSTKVAEIPCFDQPCHLIKELEAALTVMGEARFTVWIKNHAAPAWQYAYTA